MVLKGVIGVVFATVVAAFAATAMNLEQVDVASDPEGVSLREHSRQGDGYFFVAYTRGHRGGGVKPGK